MKKKLFYFLILLFLGLAITYYLRYQRGICVCDAIPKEASAVVFLNTRNIEKHFLHDLLTHPMDYLKSDKSLAPQLQDEDSANDDSEEVDAKNKVPRLTSFIKTPKSILFYQTENRGQQWTSSKLKVTDESKLKEFLTANDFEAIESADANIYQAEKKYIIVDDNFVQFAYAPKGMYKDKMAQDKYLKSGHPIFDTITKSSSDALYVDKEGQALQLNFESGAIRINGQYAIPALKPSTEKIDNEGIGSLSANVDLDQLASLLGDDMVDDFSNFTKLSFDSLSTHWNGQINGVLQGFSTSTDTIKTYEYDDDFNKVEVPAFNDVYVPDYSVQLDMNEDGVSYMKRQKAIVNQDGKDILAIMPLAKTYVESIDGLLNLYTSKQDYSRSKTDQKLIGYLDIQGSLGTMIDDFDLFGSQINQMKEFRVSINNDNQIEGHITLETKRNALVTLIKK